MPRLLFLILLCGISHLAAAQPFDASWYDPEAPYLKVGVVADGVHLLQGSDLAAHGVDLSRLDPTTLRLLEHGREVPLWIRSRGAGLAPTDSLLFVGRRNRGDQEAWAYDGDASLQSSRYRSLFADTTTYWLTWGGDAGLRYTTPQAAALPPASTARDTLHVEEDVTYHYGDAFESGTPLYTRGEGYYAHVFSHNGTAPLTSTYALPLPHADPNGGPITVRVRLNGQTATQHSASLAVERRHTGSAVLETLDTVTWSGYAFQELTATVLPADLSPSGELRVAVTSHNDFDATPNRVLLDYVEAAYTRRLQAHEGVQAFTGAAATYTLTGHTGRTFVLAPAPGHGWMLPASGDAQPFAAPAPGPTPYFAADADRLLTPAAVVRDVPSDLADDARTDDYVIVTTALLAPTAQQLAAYRAAHDGYRTVVVDVQDVYDQFDYGRATPIALRRFVRALTARPHAPRFLTLWGDAPFPVYTALETRARQPWEVPSYGFSSSDGWFAMQEDGPDDWSESLAVGRVPVRTPEDALLFLDKLAGYEARPLEDWQKRMLLLSGGSTDGEQQVLQHHSDRWGATAAIAPTGMDTLHFVKKAFDPLDLTFQDSLRVALRRGAGWLNYFGHSAAQTWEIVTDAPDAFDNAERLPFVVSLGCRTGAFAGGLNEIKSLPSYGEQLVVGSMNGAIAHWGSSDAGAVSTSALLNDYLIEEVFADTARVLGPAIRRAKARFIARHGFTDAVRHVLQYGLLGDPATRLALPDAPDLHVTRQDLFLAPAAPTPADSSLALTVRVHNRGLVPADSVDLQVDHLHPDGLRQTLTRRLAPFTLQQTTRLSLPLRDASVGDNQIDVLLDPAQHLAEADETNNVARAVHTVFSNGLVLLAPRPFGLVDTPRPGLRVSLSGGAESPLPIIFELDEAPDFSSAQRQTAVVPAAAPFTEWQPEAPLTPGRLYFWRARLDDPSQPANWQTGSFSVRPDLAGTGWLQQGPLFDESTHDAFLSREDGAWRYSTFNSEIQFTSERGAGSFKGAFFVNGNRFNWRGLGFGMLVIDGHTGAVRDVAVLPTYAIPESQVRRLGIDSTQAVARLQQMVADLREGDYVFMNTRPLSSLSGPTIQPEVRAALQQLGSTAIDTLVYGDLWLFSARHGYPETIREWVSDTTNEIVQDTVLAFPYPEGRTVSPRIGPARRWGAVGWEVGAAGPDAAVRVDVLADDGETVLLADVAQGAALEALDPAIDPFVRLRATLSDSTLRTPPQLQAWHVTYDGVAELALDAAGLTLSADTLDEGQPLTLTATARNLSPAASAPAHLAVYLTDAANRTTLVAVDTLAALPADAAAEATVTLTTEGLAGTNRLKAQLVQPGPAEPVTFNNVALAAFTVRADRQAPTLTVHVDDVAYPHDPDPVTNLRDPAFPFLSARPTVEVLLEDDARFLPLRDPALIDLRLDGAPIAATAPGVTFEPAPSAGSPARLRFTPDLGARDTTHTLLVRATDASGNEAAAYQLHFRVQTALEVPSLYPYPNPMASATTFAFQLRGADPLLMDDLRLRIFTLDGRLVRVFDLLDDPGLLDGGGLRIGWNKLRWDTRDEDGDLLASGIYLYKVYARAEGRTLEVNNASGVEKLAIIR